MIHKSCDWIVRLEPLLTFVSKLFGKSKLNSLIVLIILILKLDLVSVNRLKVFLSFLSRGCTQSFVIFNLEWFQVFSFRPVFVLRNCKESFNYLVTF